ncbi:MAG: hypothetical protein ACREM2_01090, partial [Vulcanimicrobiaceae bacterium]
MSAPLRWALAACLAGVVALGIWFVAHRATAPATAAAPAAPSVPLATAQLGELAVHVQAQGTVGPPAGTSAKLAFPEAGVLQTIDVHVGETVAAGAPLAELNRARLAAA